jgi:uncharacterized protein (TIGR03067 family)
MRSRALLVAATALGLMAYAPAPFPRPDRKDDLKTLEGTWTVARYERGGAAVRIGTALKVRIEGSKWSFFRVDATGTKPSTAYNFVLDPKKDPRCIDLTMMGANPAPGGNGKLMGIYRFERKNRNEIQVVFHTFGVNKRPAGFDGADGQAYLMILQREKR